MMASVGARGDGTRETTGGVGTRGQEVVAPGRQQLMAPGVGSGSQHQPQVKILLVLPVLRSA